VEGAGSGKEELRRKPKGTVAKSPGLEIFIDLLFQMALSWLLS